MESEVEKSKPYRRSLLTAALVSWFCLVLAFFAWQSFFYRGFVERLAEWQFGSMGGYYPNFTLALLVLLFGVPVFYLFSKRRDSAEFGGESVLRTARHFFYFLALCAITLAVMAIGRLWTGYSIVRGAGTETELSAGSAPPSTLESGRIRLTGRVLYNRQGELTQRTWLLVDHGRFAPMVGQGQASSSITYFVEVDERAPPRMASVSGLLVRNGMRPAGVRLFENNGYNVAKPHYVLYTQAQTVLAPYKREALKYALFALLLTVIASYQYWRIRKQPQKRSGTPHMTR